jgi:hypothetical protein
MRTRNGLKHVCVCMCVCKCTYTGLYVPVRNFKFSQGGVGHKLTYFLRIRHTLFLFVTSIEVSIVKPKKWDFYPSQTLASTGIKLAWFELTVVL